MRYVKAKSRAMTRKKFSVRCCRSRAKNLLKELRRYRTPMYVDTHAHLSHADFAAELPAVLARAYAAGVGRIISVATTLNDARQNLELARRHDGVFAAVGLHPGEVPNVTVCDMKELAALAAEPGVVAIGETGLDYYREAKDNATLRQQQQDLFWAQLELAKQRRLPVVIHSRGDVQADLLHIVHAHAETLPKELRPWGVMHCFSGDEKFASECIEIGLLISYTGILTFKNAAALRAVARKVPLDFVMLETDAPYLAPVPHRGTRNEPANVPLIAETLAQIKGVSAEEIARVTSENAARLFRFDQSR
jgi:TatD DNase family protein